MSQDWAVGEIDPGTTSPATDITKLTQALNSLKSSFSGASLPTTNLVAGMEVTLNDGTRWRRNMANDGWETVASVILGEIGYIGLFYKTDPITAAFTKTGANTLSIKAGARVDVAGTVVMFTAATAITMPTLAVGTDYAIWVKDDATIQATTDHVNAPGAGSWRKIGGFHYGLVTAGMTASIANGFNTSSKVTRNGTTTNASAVITGLASTADLMAGMTVSGTGIGAGAAIATVDSASQVTLTVNSTASAAVSLTFTNTGMVWTQTHVDDIAGINKYSIWDLKFRPAAADPRGMALVNGCIWVDIYLCSTDTAANGTSKSGTNIASGTVMPKIPAAFGGNGTVTYPSLNWLVANELARANQKRLMRESEFVDSAFGVAENQSIGGASSTYPTTQRNAGYTSKYGIEQASGHQWIWGEDSSFYSEAASPAGLWKQVNGNTGAAGSERGQTYTFGTYGIARVILGGARTVGAGSGSRTSFWDSYPWVSYWSVGLRAACDHLISV